MFGLRPDLASLAVVALMPPTPAAYLVHTLSFFPAFGLRDVIGRKPRHRLSGLRDAKRSLALTYLEATRRQG